MKPNAGPSMYLDCAIVCNDRSLQITLRHHILLPLDQCVSALSVTPCLILYLSQSVVKSHNSVLEARVAELEALNKGGRNPAPYTTPLVDNRGCPAEIVDTCWFKVCMWCATFCIRHALPSEVSKSYDLCVSTLGVSRDTICRFRGSAARGVCFPHEPFGCCSLVFLGLLLWFLHVLLLLLLLLFLRRVFLFLSPQYKYITSSRRPWLHQRGVDSPCSVFVYFDTGVYHCHGMID